MSWWSRLFPPRAIMVDVELGQLAKDKRDLEEHIRELKLDLGHAMNLVQTEYKKLKQARETLVAVREETLNIEDTISYKRLNETIRNQTLANARLAALLMEAEARANDANCARIAERHHNIRTGGY